MSLKVCGTTVVCAFVVAVCSGPAFADSQVGYEDMHNDCGQTWHGSWGSSVSYYEDGTGKSNVTWAAETHATNMYAGTQCAFPGDFQTVTATLYRNDSEYSSTSGSIGGRNAATWGSYVAYPAPDDVYHLYATHTWGQSSPSKCEIFWSAHSQAQVTSSEPEYHDDPGNDLAAAGVNVPPQEHTVWQEGTYQPVDFSNGTASLSGNAVDPLTYNVEAPGVGGTLTTPDGLAHMATNYVRLGNFALAAGMPVIPPASDPFWLVFTELPALAPLPEAATRSTVSFLQSVPGPALPLDVSRYLDELRAAQVSRAGAPTLARAADVVGPALVAYNQALDHVLSAASPEDLAAALRQARTTSDGYVHAVDVFLGGH